MEKKWITLKAEIIEVGRNSTTQNSRSIPVIKKFCCKNGLGYTPQLEVDFEMLLWYSHGKDKTKPNKQKSQES